jgi:hypothetical protein
VLLGLKRKFLFKYFRENLFSLFAKNHTKMTKTLTKIDEKIFATTKIEAKIFAKTKIEVNIFA